jgi:hypothetical protein
MGKRDCLDGFSANSYGIDLRWDFRGQQARAIFEGSLARLRSWMHRRIVATARWAAIMELN